MNAMRYLWWKLSRFVGISAHTKGQMPACPNSSLRHLKRTLIRRLSIACICKHVPRCRPVLRDWMRKNCTELKRLTVFRVLAGIAF